MCQLFLHSDTAYGVVAELGELGIVQFKDVSMQHFGLNTFQLLTKHDGTYIFHRSARKNLANLDSMKISGCSDINVTSAFGSTMS